MVGSSYFCLAIFLTIFSTSLLSESLSQFVSCLNFFPLLSGSVFIMRIFCFPVSSLNRSQRHLLIEYFLRKPDLYPSFISSKIKWLLNFEQAIFAWWIFIDRNAYARLLRALNRLETSSPLQSESHGPSVARTCKSKQKFQKPFSSVNFILIGLLQMLFFTMAILLCAARDAQCKTSNHLNYWENLVNMTLSPLERTTISGCYYQCLLKKCVT